jgi:WD40 repeat protein
MEKFTPLPVVQERFGFHIHHMKDGRDGKTLAMTGVHGIHRFNYRSKECDHIQTPRATYDLDVDEKGTVAAGAPRGHVYLCENGSAKTLEVWKKNYGFAAAQPVFSPDGTRLALGRNGTEREKDIAFMIDARSGKTVENKTNVTHVAWHKSAGLAWAEGDGENRRIRVGDREVPAKRLVNSLAFSPDGTRILWCGPTGAYQYVIPAGKKELVWKTDESEGDMTIRIAITRNNRIAAIGMYNGSVTLLRMEDRRELMRIDGPKQSAYVSGLEFLEDDRWIAFTRMDGTLEIYETMEG